MIREVTLPISLKVLPEFIKLFPSDFEAKRQDFFEKRDAAIAQLDALLDERFEIKVHQPFSDNAHDYILIILHKPNRYSSITKEKANAAPLEFIKG